MDKSVTTYITGRHRLEQPADVMPHYPDRTIAQLASIVARISKYSAFSNLEELLRFAVVKIPRLVNSAGGVIYLRPELTPLYDGVLIDASRQVIRAEELKREFVVLAATSRPELVQLSGKAYLPIDDGPIGWVVSHGQPLLLGNESDSGDLKSLTADLQWGDCKQADSPILVVPLVAHVGILGIIVFPAVLNHQSLVPAAEEIAAVAAQSVALVLERTWIVREQDRHLRYLADFGGKHQPQKLFEEVTRRLSRMLNTQTCQLYLRINGGRGVKLIVEDGRFITDRVGKVYQRGQNLVGWVLKTGKPLLIRDMQEFSAGKVLTGTDLDRLSDGPPLNTDDRFLQCEPQTPAPTSFLAVPIKDGNGLVLGVLSAQCTGGPDGRVVQTFNRDDLMLAQSSASIIALAISHELQRKLDDLLTRLGPQSDAQTMFDLVVRHLPELVAAPGCNIYMLENGDRLPPRLRLVKTSYAKLMNEAQAGTLTYQPGEGKTGFCALARASLIVNHYGAGEAGRRKIDNERARIRASGNSDLVERLTDEHSELVGLIWLKRGAQASSLIQQAFHTLVKQLVVHRATGLPSPRAADYQSWGIRPTWSFVAVPIKTDADEIYGVITISRPAPDNPFSADDVTLLESIAQRLASAISILKVQERQQRLMVTLAHEISTPLQGILADTENLIYELPEQNGLSQLASHTLHQVQQLHLLTETIMAVISEQTPARSFSIHSLYRPLKDACKMFEREAAAKGCDILEPRPVGSRFPDVEMSLFDLTLAFKNLIHNAIKYSFHPPRHLEGNRYIRIIGRWADADHHGYSVSIENYGVGIPQEEIDNGAIFTPYYRGVKASDRRRTGAGLGLAHARQIIENLHNGTIAVTSKHIAGEAYLTTFTATVPVFQPGQIESLSGGKDHA